MDESKQQPPIGFCHDIYTEILLRLPVKSVLNFQSVSKLWLSIVSDPQFRQNHSSRHKDSIGLLFRLDYSQSIFGLLTLNINPNISSFNLSPNRPKGHIVATCISFCNGLQLSKSAKWTDPDHTYCVSNPTTNDYVFLDIPPHIRKHRFVLASLAFDPSKSLDYKVIFLSCQHMYSNDFRLEVYSSATGECKVPACNTYVGKFCYDENICGIYWNGAIHWLSTNADSVIYFNVHTESIKEISTPYLARNVHYFGESRGHLHLVHSDHQHFYRSSVLEVYELERDYSDWFLKYKVELASITSGMPQLNARKDYGTLMNIYRDEEEDCDDSTIVILVCGQWVEYSIIKKTTRMLCEYAPALPCTSPFPSAYWFNTFQFIPTLTSV